VQQLRRSLITEGNVIEHNIAVHIRRQCIGILPLLFGIEDFAQTVNRNTHFAHVAENPAQVADRPRHHRVVRNKNRELAQRQPAFHRFPRAEQNHHKDLHPGHKIADAPVWPEQLGEFNPQRCEKVVLAVKILHFISFAPERTHHADAGEVFLHRCRKRAFGFIGGAKPARNQVKEHARID